MQKLYSFKIILAVALSAFFAFANAQTPILLAPDNAPVESTVLSEYSGNLGIGIAMPTVKLDVSGGGKFTGALEAQKLKLADGEIDGSGTLYLSPTGSGSIKVTIAANANVGIGQSNTFSNAANNLIVGQNNVLSSTASHHLVVGMSNEASGLFGFTHGSGNEINAGVLAGFNYAMGKQNTINFNQTVALSGFNYTLGMHNDITSNAASGVNYIFGVSNNISYTPPSGEGGSGIGANFITGGSNTINVNQSGLEVPYEIGENFITGFGNEILGASIGCFQNGFLLKSTDAVGAFTIGIGDFANVQRLVNNHSQSLMVGFGTQPTFFVQDNHVGINTTTMNDAALRITTRDDEGGTKLDIQAAGDEGWQNQIRFMDNSGNFRHLIVDDFESNNLVIMPGYWNGGNPVASNVLKIDGKLKIGNVTTPSLNSYSLYVEKGILAESFKCALKSTSDWSDYVFDECYELKPLDEVKDYIRENKRLPDVPSAEEMVKNGLDVAKTDALLLRKIEELTLYVIELETKLNVVLATNKK